MKLIKRILALFMCAVMLSTVWGSVATTAEASEEVTVLDETTENAALADVCDECGTSEVHAETCSSQMARALNMEPIGCGECDQIDVHAESCSLYEVTKETLTELSGPQVGDKIWIKKGSLVWKEYTKPDMGSHKLLGNYEIKIKNIILDESGTPAWYEFEFTSLGIGEAWLWGAGYKYIKVDNTTVEQPESEEVTLENAENGIAVAGKFPEGVALSVEPATLEEISTYNAELSYLTNPYKAYDISMLQNDAEWQPGDGETVNVTLDASDLGADGDDMLVYHVHPNEDGTADTELLGPFNVQDGKISFEMTRFSYVLVFEGTAEYTISDVEMFYSAAFAEGGSGNGHYQFLGIYYDSNGDTHFLLATIDNTPQKFQDWFIEFYIDDHRFVVSETDVSSQPAIYNTVEFKDANGISLESVPITEKGNVAYGFFDVNIGKVNVGRNFEFAVSDKLNRKPDKSNGWNILSTVTVNLEYNLVKTVAQGTSANATFAESITVDRGDWVIYKIEVNNTGTLPLTGMKVTDVLPPDVFDMNTVQMSIDLTGETNWQPFNEIMFDDYSSEGEFTNTIYIKAQVLSKLNITSDTTYTNTATIDGMNMPTISDSADIVVNAPKTGTLTVSKAVTSENPNDPADPNAEFTFKIESKADVDTFSYKVDEITYTVVNGGTFTLKNGQSAIFDEFPIGEFTVTEINNEGYATKVNGTERTTYTDEMTSQASPVVAFENQFSTRFATLSITKIVDKEYANDIIPDDKFTFTVVIGDGTDTTTAYSYKNGNVSGSVTSGGTIELKGGETAVISGIPVGMAYTITEAADDDYITRVGQVVTNSATGTMSLNNAAVSFTNIYKRHLADLTISKSGVQDIDENQSFIFTVEGMGVKLDVVINGNNSVTIKDLPIGDYKVVENTDWSWRYTPAFGGEQTRTLVVDDDNTVSFSNNRSWIYWLSGDSYNENQFTVKSRDEEN